MRWLTLASALALVLTALGCERHGEQTPTVAEYEKNRQAMLRRAQAAQAAGVRQPARTAAAPSEAEEKAGLLSSGGTHGYRGAGLRDPFRSFVLERTKELAEEERGPLEQFDLAQLTVVAIVWGTDRARAMIEDPSGRGYVIQEGTAIGKNDGYVTRISDNSVTVLETYVDYLGDSTQKEIEMRVRATTQGG